MERRKFTRELKLEAVRLIKDRGVSYVQASQDLGVHPSQLRDWVKKFADDPLWTSSAVVVCSPKHLGRQTSCPTTMEGYALEWRRVSAGSASMWAMAPILALGYLGGKRSRLRKYAHCSVNFCF
jgi:hypothetical protein